MTHNPLIRAAVSDDAEALAHLHLAVWEEAYTGLMPDRVFEQRRANVPERVERWRSILESSRASVLVAETVTKQGTKLIGFAINGPARDSDMTHEEELWALYVRAAHWGDGVGHALLETALGDRPAYLWVLQGNDRAIAFYQRHGFVVGGTVRTDDLGTELRMAR